MFYPERESGLLCLVPSDKVSSTLTTGGNLMTHTEGRRKETSKRRRTHPGVDSDGDPVLMKPGGDLKTEVTG